MNVMSAWTTEKPGYTVHRETAVLPVYDRKLFHETKGLDDVFISNKEWHTSVTEDTNDC